MPIPTSRAELTSQICTSYEKLREELDDAGSSIADAPCVDDWTVKDLLAVRTWWTENVMYWVVAENRQKSDRATRSRLDQGYRRVLATIELLDDTELLEVGVYPWAGK